MIYFGSDAISFLGMEIHSRDSSESSHWQKFHSNFEFSKDGFRGLIGFGGCRGPYRGLMAFLNSLLQSPYRKSVSPKFLRIDGIANSILQKQKRAYDIDVLRQAITVSYLEEILPKAFNAQALGCVIGDGFATTASLLLRAQLARSLVLVNLTKTLLVDLWYLRLTLGREEFDRRLILITAIEDIERITKDSIVAIQAKDCHLLGCLPIDYVINIASMQEMDKTSIKQYFSEFRRISSTRELVFYCCNRLEKSLPDGALIKFDEYPWHSMDKFLVDELCPWHQRYYKFTPPFYRSYDGPIWHRLAIMGSDSPFLI